MSYSLGIDVGTTFTAAGIWRDGRAETVQLGDRGFTVPTVVFVRDDGEVLVGEAANRRAVTEPARVAREFKRRIGDQVPLLLGGQPVTAQALTGHMLRWVAARVSEREGGPPAYVTLTCPANWTDFRRNLIAQAATDAGIPGVGLLTEPVAAAIYYAAQGRLDPGDAVGVYDLGGGTFDATVLRRTATGFELVGEPSGDEQLGGVDFDQAVLDHVVTVLGNAWEGLDLADPTVLRGIAQLRSHVVDAKEALSTDVETSIPVILPGINREVRLTRTELEEMVRQPLLQTMETFEDAVRTAGVQPRELRAILLVGGSSRIPLVAELIATEVGVPVAVDAHPKFAVCLGAAIDASGRLTGAADPAATTSFLALPPGAATTGGRARPAVPGTGRQAAAGGDMTDLEATAPGVRPADLIAGPATAAGAPGAAMAGGLAGQRSGARRTGPVVEPDTGPPTGPMAGPGTGPEVGTDTGSPAWVQSDDPGMSWWDAPPAGARTGQGPAVAGVAGAPPPAGPPVGSPAGPATGQEAGPVPGWPLAPDPPGWRDRRDRRDRDLDDDAQGRRRRTALAVGGATLLVAAVAVVAATGLVGGGGGSGGDGGGGGATSTRPPKTTTAPTTTIGSVVERIPAAWATAAALPTPLEAAAVTEHDGKVWVVGGSSPAPGRPNLRTVQVYDPETGSWSDGPRLPKAVSHAAAVSDGKSIYLLGGEDPAPVATVLRLDEPDGRWVRDTPLPAPRTAAAAAWDGSRIVFGGGFEADKKTRADDVWALEGGEWKPIGKLQRARDHLAAASDGAGTVWFLAGAQTAAPGKSGAVDAVTADRVDPAGRVEPRRAPAAFWLPGIGACVIGGQGIERAGATASCLEREHDGDLPRLRRALAGIAAAVVPDRGVYVMGGFGGGLEGSDVAQALEFEEP